MPMKTLVEIVLVLFGTMLLCARAEERSSSVADALYKLGNDYDIYFTVEQVELSVVKSGRVFAKPDSILKRTISLRSNLALEEQLDLIAKGANLNFSFNNIDRHICHIADSQIVSVKE